MKTDCKSTSQAGRVQNQKYENKRCLLLHISFIGKTWMSIFPSN